jgi:hypothetical protein
MAGRMPGDPESSIFNVLVSGLRNLKVIYDRDDGWKPACVPFRVSA